jgi:hypothetical protein
VKHPLLFEISAWPWLERLSRRERRGVTLADVPAEAWDSIAERGFSLVFLMGVWKRSPLGRELALADHRLRAEYDRALSGWTPPDVVGSPYCICAYEPDPRMGGWAGLDAAREQLNRRGIGLVLDFVPNHTAFDHPWTIAQPDRYVIGTPEDAERAAADFRRVGTSLIACGRDPFFPPWRDVAQLNYFNPETRTLRTPVQLGRWADEPVDARLTKTYDALLAATSAPLFHDGVWKLLETSSAGEGRASDLIAFRWRWGEELGVVVVNLGSDVASAHVSVVQDLPDCELYDFADRLTDTTYRWTRRSLDARGHTEPIRES